MKSTDEGVAPCRKTNRRSFCKEGGLAAAGGLTLARLPALFNTDMGKGEFMAEPVTSVTAKVISVKGTCGLGHKVGDVVKFTESGVEGRICIHALYSMMPAVFAMLYDASFPWLQDPDKKTHPCTDAANPVVFEIARHRQKA